MTHQQYTEIPVAGPEGQHPGAALIDIRLLSRLLPTSIAFLVYQR